jgi:DNA mismatch repair protein MutS2
MEELIKHLKEESKDGLQHNIETARRRLKEAAENAGANLRLEEEPDTGFAQIVKEKLKIGDQVYVAALKQKGEVLAVSQETITVQLGMMKTNVAASDCRVLAEGRTAQEAAPKKYFSPKSGRSESGSFAKTAPRQIDIRGLTIEEAEIELEKYIDSALLGGLSEILIIHGKGTGALRKGVKQYLENHSKVKETQIAETNAGGYGATVAKLI